MSLRPFALLWLIGFAQVASAQAPKVLELWTQEVLGETYFYVRFENPRDIQLPDNNNNRRWNWNWNNAPDLHELPQLVPQNKEAKAVYHYISSEDLPNWIAPRRADEEGKFDDKAPVKDPDGAEKKPQVEEKKGTPALPLNRQTVMEFYGKLAGKDAAAGKVAFLLTYPQSAQPGRTKKLIGKLLPRKQSLVEEFLFSRTAFAEVPVALDFAKAKKAIRPEEEKPDPKRARLWPQRTDLRRSWALAETITLGRLASDSADFGFYTFALQTTASLYDVPNVGNQLFGNRFNLGGGLNRSRDLYNVTTGAAAITESLALQRMRNPNFRNKDEKRTVPIEKIAGVTIAEHPWVKMMEGKKPAPEPLAELVPHDFYYIHFKNIAKLLETGDLLDQWGTTLTRAFESNSKDNRLKQKLEQQLCLKSTGLARIFGPSVINGVAIVGSDPYLREGTDLSMIFHLANKQVFQFAVEGVLKQTRTKFGKDLIEKTEKFGDVAIESAVTLRREVSMHRAYFGEFVVYSNSGAAVKAILETHAGKRPSLAKSLDFQYMRTIFRNDDKEEDGFIFLSDPFIRNLVGPALRIKERRRLEAMASMAMVTNGALYTAWSKGRLPSDHGDLLQATGLKSEQLFSPEGEAVAWSSAERLAISSAYNTIHFATPLLEIPIDNVTATEAQEYENFRRDYMGLWRQFFDPIGMRIAIRGKKVQWDTYILPLVRNTQYDELRRTTGDGTITIYPGDISKNAVFQTMFHVSPEAWSFGPGGFGVGMFLPTRPRDFVKSWGMVRFDDSPVYAELLELYIREQFEPNRGPNFNAWIEKIAQIPVTAGFDMANPVILGVGLAAIRGFVHDAAPDLLYWKAQPAYKDVSIVRIGLNPKAQLVRNFVGEVTTQPAVYYATFDGAFYIGLREEPIKELIDQFAERRDGKAPKESSEGTKVNASLYVSPAAMTHTKKLLAMYLEWESYRRAQANNRVLYAFYHTGLIDPSDSSEKAEETVFKLLGYIPVSPDLSPYRYEANKDEVVNARHGSLRHPKVNRAVESGSPIGLLLEQMLNLRADLRFREDGIHTVLTINKK